MVDTAVIKEKKGISGTAIKLIALAAMFIDHLAAIFFNAYLQMKIPEGLTQEQNIAFFHDHQGIAIVNMLYILMRLVGRFGFPLFAFLLVEGFEHTRSVKKYALNMLVFALISELPFDLGFSGKLFYPTYQNVFFTLLLGLLCISGTRYFAESRKDDVLPGPLFYASTFLAGASAAYMIFYGMWPGWVLRTIVFGEKQSWKQMLMIMGCAGLISMLIFLPLSSKWDTARKNRFTGIIIPFFVTGTIAEILMTDYSAGGVLTILIIYILRSRRAFAFSMACLELFLMSFSEFTAFIMLIPVKLYNGKRGKKMNKYIFYAFYPVHIGLLYILTLLMGYTSFAFR
ncbi:MAG: conjugal transfer protein TraX [Lachnospiraceae bacterium]|nr:conjugal transfer protein TraX [Lachnospiraceae bacterium]